MAVKGRGKVCVNDTKKENEKTLAGPKSETSINNTETTMDEFLRKRNLYRKPIAKDGSCLFRIVAEQIYHTQAKHYQVRLECIEFMRQNKELFESFIEGSFEHYLFLLRSRQEWGGQVEISALSLLYKSDFIIYQNADAEPSPVTCNGFKRKIYLCYLNGNHYDALYPLGFKANAAMVQSILYDVVLNSVFPELDRRETLAEQNAEEGNTSAWTQVKSNKSKASTEGQCNDKATWQVKRSLDPDVYRNIEVEAWEESKKSMQRSDRAIVAMMQFKPGDLCYATIKESKDVSDTIRVIIVEVQGDDRCIVLSEDKKNRYYVSLPDLRHIGGSDETYKNLPGYYQKYENDSEFQQQKKRAKGRRERGEDGGRPARDFKRHEKDQRNGRRSHVKKEIEQKKREVEKPAKLELSEVKEVNSAPPTPATPATPASENEVKVALPAESSAAFWGRMRVKPIPTSTSMPTPQLETTKAKNEPLLDVVTSSKSLESSVRTEPSLHTKTAWKNVPPVISESSKPSDDKLPKPPLEAPSESVNAPSNTTEESKDPLNTARMFNLSTQASAKVNEVRENIIASSPRMGELITTTMHNQRPPTNKIKASNDAKDHRTTCSLDEVINTNVQQAYDETADVSDESLNVDESATDRKERSKKKVSFANSDQIFENKQTTAAVSNHVRVCEPGKIKLPPDHIEKHVKEFPPMHDARPFQSAPYYQQAAILPNMYYQNNMTDHALISPSHDPEGKDLPEDIATLRHYFNLGVQYYYLCLQQQQQQQNAIQMSQPSMVNQGGILPLPVQSQQLAAQVLTRQVLINSDANISQPTDAYPSNQAVNDASLLDFQQHQLLFHHMVQQHQPLSHSYEHYELPPRLRRGAPTRNTNGRYPPRYSNQRGGGIMGQGPRTRMELLPGVSAPQSMNFY